MVQRSPALDTLRVALLDTGSAYLRNVRWDPGTTCRVCAGVTKDGWPTCYRCHARAHSSGLADRLGLVTYAWNGHQSGRVMYGYKTPAGSPANLSLVRSMLTYAVAAHWPCISAGVGAPHSWAVVPSLSGRPGPPPTTDCLPVPGGPTPGSRLHGSRRVGSPRVCSAELRRARQGIRPRALARRHLGRRRPRTVSLGSPKGQRRKRRHNPGPGPRQSPAVGR